MNDLNYIVLEDDHLLALNKPAGVPTVSLREGEMDTLAAWVLEHYPEQGELPQGRLEAGMVHRLDNDTSGLVLAARTGSSYQALREAFTSQTVDKRYLALVVGQAPTHLVLEWPIAHHPSKKKRMVVCETPTRAAAWKARPAHTELWCRKRFVVEPGRSLEQHFSLLEVRIRSGVRHQIRVHLASLGHPLVGDRLYRHAKPLEALSDLEHHFLHAWRLRLNHPATGEALKLEVGLPEAFQALLDRLGAWAER